MRKFNGLLSFRILASLALASALIAAGRSNLANAQGQPGQKSESTPASAIALRDQLRLLLNTSAYTGSFKELGSHVVMTKVGTVYTLRRSNVVVATYYTKDKYVGARVVNPEEEDNKYYPITKYCLQAAVVSLPDVTPSPLSDNCRRAVAMGKASLLQAGRKVLIADLELFPDQDQAAFTLIDHRVGSDGSEDSRYTTAARVQFTRGFLATADAGAIVAALKSFLAPSTDPLFQQPHAFLPDAPLPAYTLEDQLNAYYNALHYRLASGTIEQNSALRVKAPRFLRAVDMHSMLTCPVNFADGKPLKPSLICRSFESGEPTPPHNAWVAPNDELEVVSIKVESKKDRDNVKFAFNDFSQQSGVTQSRLGQMVDVDVFDDHSGNAENLDQGGYKTAIVLQYPRGLLDRDGLKRVSDDIAAMFNVERDGAPASAAPPAAMTALNTAPYTPADNTPQPLEAQLKTLFKLAQVGGDSTVIAPGTLFTVSKPNTVLGTPAARQSVCAAISSDGALKPPPASCITPLRPSIAKHESTFFASGQKLDLVDISVNVPKETVTFTMVDQAAKARYRTAVNFVFPQGYLESSDAGQVGDAVNNVLPMVDSSSTPPPAPTAAGNTAPPPAALAPARTPAHAAAPAPSADPDAGPVQVAKGMSIADVRKSMGAPKQAMVVGPKIIYVYSAVKVTFVNGKVANVE